MTLPMADIANVAGLGLVVALSLGVMLLILWRPWQPTRKPDLILPVEAVPAPHAEALQAWMGSLSQRPGTAAAHAAPDAGACIIPLFADRAIAGGTALTGRTQPLRRRA